jgi:translation elongation factor EF-Tu-like GTPase
MDNINPQAQDTFISEKIEVTVQDGDTVDTAKIVNLVTKEVPEFDGNIGSLKEKLKIEEDVKVELLKQVAFTEGKITELQNKIAKFTPEVEAKLNSANT